MYFYVAHLISKSHDHAIETHIHTCLGGLIVFIGAFSIKILPMRSHTRSPLCRAPKFALSLLTACETITMFPLFLLCLHFSSFISLPLLHYYCNYGLSLPCLPALAHAVARSLSFSLSTQMLFKLVSACFILWVLF